MSKSEVYQQELAKLTGIFKDVDEPKRKLVEGLIEDAAFLKSENFVLKEVLTKTGMIKVHPEHLELQKPVEAAKQYLKNINSYSVVIKTLNGVLNKNMIEDGDELEEFE
jgi:regulator of replication initiation timing